MLNDSSDPQHVPPSLSVDSTTQQQSGSRGVINGTSPILESECKTGWGPLTAILYSIAVFVGCYFAADFIAVGIAEGVGHHGDAARSWVLDTITGQFVFTLLFESLVVLAVVLFVKLRSRPLVESGITQFRWRYLWIAIAGYIGYFLFYAIAFAVLSGVFPQLNSDQQQDIGFRDPIGTSQLALTYISLAILPPIAEEVLFRGFMFKGLRRSLRFAPAAIITSLLFAAGHLQFGSGEPLLWVAGLDTFILSMLLCWLRERTGSIWAGVIIHALKNSMAFVFLYLVTH